MYPNDDQEDLLDAVSENNLRRVNALLKKGIDPDFDDNYRGTPLTEAIANGNLAMVKALVAAGADVNRGKNQWEKPLDVADRKGNAKIIDWLESQGAQSAEPGRLNRKQQALMDAIDYGDTRKAQTLLKNGLDPDFANDDEETPLDLAIRRGSETLVRALVNAGADVNRVNSYKEAPLDVAKEEGDTAITQYLESEGAVTGKTKGTKARTMAKKARGSSVGMQEDFGDDFWDEDKYFFGADEDEGRRKNNGPKPKVTPKSQAAKAGHAGGGAPEPKKPPKPVFREDTLKDIFNAQNWIGKADEMEELWNEVPKRLHKHFDIAAALAEARRETLKQNAPRQRIALQANLKPPAPAPEAVNAQNVQDVQDAQSDAKPPETPCAPPQPPKPPAQNT